MTLFSSLSIAMSGLQAASTRLQLTASNVSNAATEGYTRKSATTASARLGTVGGGVQVTGFTRASDDVLFTALTNATSESGLRSTQDDYLQQVQDILGTSSSDTPGLTKAVANFSTMWTNLAAAPESAVAQQNVIQAGVNLADQIKKLSNDVEDLDRQGRTDVTNTLKDLNGYLGQISDLNSKISLATTSGEAAGDLQDQRDQLVLKVANLVGIKVLNRSNGQIAIYTQTGYQLVDGSTVRTFEYNGADVYDTQNPALSLNDTLTEGKLGAIVKFRDTSAAAASSADPAVGVIQKLRDQLDAISQSFLTTVTTATSGAATFAAAYNGAATGTGELASSFFTGTNRTDFAVNANLLNGTSKIKQAAAKPVVTSMLDATRSFTASGLSTTGSNYTTLTTSSLTVFQQAANNVGTLSDTASSQKSYMQQKYTNATNVNTDEEMVNLVTLQNVYAANARIISVVRDLFQILESTVQ